MYCRAFTSCAKPAKCGTRRSGWACEATSQGKEYWSTRAHTWCVASLPCLQMRLPVVLGLWTAVGERAQSWIDVKLRYVLQGETLHMEFYRARERGGDTARSLSSPTRPSRAFVCASGAATPGEEGDLMAIMRPGTPLACTLVIVASLEVTPLGFYSREGVKGGGEQGSVSHCWPRCRRGASPRGPPGAVGVCVVVRLTD